MEPEARESPQARITRLERANEELETFCYSLTHALRGPLAASGIFTQLLARNHAETLDDEGRHLLDVITASTQEMRDLIDQLLAFFSLGGAPPEEANLDMRQLALEAQHRLRRQAPDWPGSFHVGLMPPARGVPGLIRQVFANLIGNAIKYTSKRAGPSIEIGGKVDGSETLYWVKDNGAGFPAERTDRLFKMFSRLHEADEFEGTGVGLALVRRIIEHHGGRVWAEGEVEQGATFAFSLPTSGSARTAARLSAFTPPRRQREGSS